MVSRNKKNLHVLSCRDKANTVREYIETPYRERPRSLVMLAITGYP